MKIIAAKKKKYIYVMKEMKLKFRVVGISNIVSHLVILRIKKIDFSFCMYILINESKYSQVHLFYYHIFTNIKRIL